MYTHTYILANRSKTHPVRNPNLSPSSIAHGQIHFRTSYCAFFEVGEDTLKVPHIKDEKIEIVLILTHSIHVLDLTPNSTDTCNYHVAS